MIEDWIETTLGEVCEINMGQSPPSSTYNTDGIGLPFFQGKAEFTDLYPEVRKWCTEPKKTAEKDDILLSVRAPVGSTNIADVNCAIGRGLAAISYKYSTKFIWYYLKSIEQHLDNQGTGTTFKAISGQQLRTQELFLPPLPIQRAIVVKIEELFSSLDSGIADLKKAQEQVKVYRQAVLKKAFEGGLTRDWRKERNIEDYENVKLKDVLFQSKEKHKPVKPENLFYVGLEHIEKETGKLTESTGIAEINTTKNKFCSNQILYGKLRPYLNKVHLTNREGVCSTDILVFNLSEKIMGKYALYYMLSLSFVNDMSNNTSGVNLPRVSTKYVNNYPIPLPSLQEQRLIVKEIENVLTSCDTLETELLDSIDKGETLRQSILKKAFEAKLLSEEEIEKCKKEHDYEPADVLLQKIKAEKKKK